MSRKSSRFSEDSAVYNTQGFQLRSKYFQIKKRESDFLLDSFLNSLDDLNIYDLDAAEKEEVLNEVDGAHLFKAFEGIHHDWTVAKLENYVLTNFLEKNDPKLLIGLHERRVRSISSMRHGAEARTGEMQSIMSSRHMDPDTQSLYSVVASTRTHTDYHLNFRAKHEMTEKVIAEAERRASKMEARALFNIKVLNANIEERRYTVKEAEETAKNFELHFIGDYRSRAFLESASTKQIEAKFRKFVSNWIKTAQVMLEKMRITITAVHESCQQHRTDLITKTDLSSVLGWVDFEQLLIKHNQLTTALDDKNIHLNGLKNVSGKASMALIEEKQSMMTLETESKSFNRKTMELYKGLKRLDRDIKMYETDNYNDEKTLRKLKEQLERFEAPSVTDYIEHKDELISLEKEEKILIRKMTILNMKLNSLLKQQKRQFESLQMEF